MSTFLHALDQKFEEVMCSMCLLVMSFCIGFQVLLRYLFHASSPWAEELAVFSMVFAVYLGASLAIRERGHIRIVILINILPRPLKILSVVLADTLWFCFLAFMAWQSIVFTELLFDVVYISPGLGIDQKWVQLFIPAAFVLMLFRMLQVYWRWGRDGWKGLPL